MRKVVFDDAGSAEVRHVGWGDGRQVYRYVIRDATGRILEAADGIRSGVSADVDEDDAMGTLLAFLGACAEGVEYERRTGHESENSGAFSTRVAEWADGIGSDTFAMEAEGWDES